MLSSLGRLCDALQVLLELRQALVVTLCSQLDCLFEILCGILEFSSRFESLSQAVIGIRGFRIELRVSLKDVYRFRNSLQAQQLVTENIDGHLGNTNWIAESFRQLEIMLFHPGQPATIEPSF